MTAVVRALREDELPETDRIFRLAFGTFLGLADPLAFAGDSDWTRGRFRADPSAALAADVDGRLAGTCFATTWGSVGFFGPVSVRPELWGTGVAKALLDATMKLLDARGARFQTLFTFAQSAKHVALYQRWGYWPRFLVAIMARRPEASGTPAATRYSEAGETLLPAVRAMTDAVYAGFDVTAEIRNVHGQGLGEAIVLPDGAGVAVCHAGPGTEAGSGVCYVKVATVAPGPGAGDRFEALLGAVEAWAASRGLGTVMAGVDTGQRDAYRRLLARGYRTVIQGVQMCRHDDVGFGGPDRYVIADWR